MENMLKMERITKIIKALIHDLSTSYVVHGSQIQKMETTNENKP